MPSFFANIAFFTSVTSSTASKLDLDIHTSRKIQSHQGIDCFGRGIQDIDNAFVRFDFKLFPCVLVLVRCTQNGDDFLVRRQRNRALNLGTRPLCGLYDPLCALVDQVVIVSFELNTNFLARHIVPPFFDIPFTRSRVCPLFLDTRAEMGLAARLSGLVHGNYPALPMPATFRFFPILCTYAHRD